MENVKNKEKAETKQLSEADLMLLNARTVEETKKALEMGADPNASFESGTTALMNAKSTEQMEVLTEAGADVFAKDENGKTALMRKSTPFSKAKGEQKEILAGSGVKGVMNRIAAAREHLRKKREQRVFDRKITKALFKGALAGIKDAKKGR